MGLIELSAPTKRGPKKPVSAAPDSIMQAVLAVVAQIPYGRVATYGQIAKLAGYPRHSRMVGRALSQTILEVPWHRVLNHKGEISSRGLDGHDDLQRVLLEEEGVVFNLPGRVDLRKFGWWAGRE
ncbi:MGMT family protein [Silvimonas soli]|uniref:MGMT family protein n=1 Tax=Silvimonas soli TaxID=2980100 RepID=UPI0024B350EA|nr:methylated-DNA--[protein]-cysteine S-methyltransferase [Silvimonas soli]